MSKQITPAWADTPGMEQKAKTNREIYEEIKHLGKAERIGTSYACAKYRVTPTTDRKLNPLEMALIADGGNLCFGYRHEGGDVVTIYTD